MKSFIFFALLSSLAFASSLQAQENEFGLSDPFGLPIDEPVMLNNHWSLGLTYVSDDNFKYGQYNGLDTNGFVLDGGWNYSAGDDSKFWVTSGTDLGTGNREIMLAMASLNGASYTFGYDEISSQFNDTGHTPYHGKRVLSLPAGWIAGAETSQFDQSLIVNDVKNGLKRRTVEMTLRQPVTRGLWTEVGVTVETKKGTRIKGAAIYFNAANPQAVTLPAPVDQKSSEFRFAAGVDTSAISVTLAYRALDFDNNYPGLSWENPFASGLGTSVDYPNGIGSVANEPDYQYQELNFSAAYRFSAKTRFTLNGLFGESRQDGKLSSYSVNPGLTVPTPLPVSDMEKPLSTTFFQVAAYTNPISHLAVNAHYQYKERDNSADRHAWQYVRGDGADQPGPEFSVFNRPLTYQQDQFKLEGIYRFRNRSSLRVSYEYEAEFRNFAAVEDTEQDQINVKYRFSRWRSFSNQLEWNHVNRSGSTYEWSRSFFQLLAVDLINQIPDDQRWINHPSLRQFHLANNNGREISWRGSYVPAEHWLLRATASRKNTDFDKSTLGLKEDLETSFNLGISYLPSDSLSIQTFVDHRRRQRSQMGRTFTGGINKPANVISPPLPQGSDPARNFKVREESNSASAGLGVFWEASERLTLDVNFTYLRVDNDYRFAANGARDLTDQALPTADVSLNEIRLDLKYSYNANLTLNLGYQYYDYADNDWRYDNISTVNKLLTTGQKNPNEAVNVMTLAMTYQF